MRYLILSDIHANVTGLEAALAAVEGKWDRAICLGDVVGYGPDPNEVVDKIRSLDAISIRGNHDKAGSGLEDAADFNPVARAVAHWTREKLTPENLDYLVSSRPARFNSMAWRSSTEPCATKTNTSSRKPRRSKAFSKPLCR